MGNFAEEKDNVPKTDFSAVLPILQLFFPFLGGVRNLYFSFFFTGRRTEIYSVAFRRPVSCCGGGVLSACGSLIFARAPGRRDWLWKTSIPMYDMQREQLAKESADSVIGKLEIERRREISTGCCLQQAWLVAYMGHILSNAEETKEATPPSL